MENKDIIINGVSINELKKQRNAIRQGAAEMIAKNIELATELTKKLVESKDKKEIEAFAKEAYEALDNANVISSVSGIDFCIPFYEEYGNYDSEEILSNLLEDNNNEVVNEVWDNGVSALCSLFYNMERQSRDWHSSRC